MRTKITIRNNLPLHWKPFPENPVLQTQLKLPMLLLQIPFTWHGSAKHSLMSSKKIKKKIRIYNNGLVRGTFGAICILVLTSLQ